ncbi:MAG: sodium:proton antiporter [Erysipelothrix sp.]|nr:sodium:proton antiporter [Erysipelothrix sp.]
MTVVIVLALIIPLGYLAKISKVPVLIYYLFAGIILGPFALGYIKFENGPLIRQAALVVIMLRSGLGLSLQSLKKVSRPAILLSFVPGLIEAAAVAIAAYFIFGFTLLQGIILGFMLAAVSPAVVVPAMLKLIDQKLGKDIPSMILASSAIDDVVALSFFTFFTSLYFNNEVSLLASILLIPLKMFLSFVLGYTFSYFIKRFNNFKLILITILALGSVYFEKYLPISALILIMAMGIGLNKYSKQSADILSDIMKPVWNIMQVFLFISVGSELNILALKDILSLGLLLIVVGLIFRSIGVLLSVKSLTKKEQLFSMFAFMPKATVQAALASVPLAMGIKDGDLMLLIAVLAIIVTTPIGATLISIMAPKLLKQE